MPAISELIEQMLGGAGLLWIGLGSGVLMVFVGLVSLSKGRDPVERRLQSSSRFPNATAKVVRARTAKPTGVMKGIVPTDQKQYSRVRRQLEQSGFRGARAVSTYFLIRTVLGLLFPALLGLYIFLKPMFNLPGPLLSQQSLLLLIAALIIVGFYGPAYYLRKRVEQRRLAISENFPNTLDLLQISVEAGLGFDQAMSRVASEMRRNCPEISDEFELAQMEISAGRDRESALLEMADRSGVPEVGSFVGVILQSMELGTSISEALTAYATDMRIQRELRAQEKANKLPVQMSGILVIFMLPALLTLVLTPMIIRFIRILGPALS